MNSMRLLRINKRKRINTVKNTLIVILLAISVFFVFIIKNTSSDVEVSILTEDIVRYIEYTEDICKDSYIIDWREVVAIFMVLNKEANTIEEKDFLDISKRFYTYKESEIISVKSFDEILKDLNITGEDKTICKAILKSLGGKSIYENLYSEKDKVSFIKQIEEEAYENYDDFGILPSITIGQGILESGWGESELTVKSNNLFGIKADSRWKGDIYKIKSKENYDDEYVSAFRSYDHMEDSIHDHGKFLSENIRYKEQGLFEAKNYINQAKALQNAGYSTVKDNDGNLIYSDKLIRVIRDYNLMSYDVNVIRKQFKN